MLFATGDRHKQVVSWQMHTVLSLIFKLFFWLQFNQFSQNGRKRLDLSLLKNDKFYKVLNCWLPFLAFVLLQKSFLEAKKDEHCGWLIVLLNQKTENNYLPTSRGNFGPILLLDVYFSNHNKRELVGRKNWRRLTLWALKLLTSPGGGASGELDQGGGNGLLPVYSVGNFYLPRPKWMRRHASRTQLLPGQVVLLTAPPGSPLNTAAPRAAMRRLPPPPPEVSYCLLAWI